MKNNKSIITFTIEKNHLGYVATIFENGKVRCYVETYSKTQIVKATNSQKKLREHVELANCFR